MNNLTLLEIILITYIFLNWFLTIMFTILPRRVINKAFFFYFIIICPPLIIGFIGELIKEKHDKRKKKRKEERK